MSIKTQRVDKGGCVCRSIRWPLNFNIVITGKSVIAFNLEVNESPSRKVRAIQIVSLSRKFSLRSTFLSVPQTDTGALVVDYQGKRATMVQGTRQQKLGVTYGRCLTCLERDRAQ